MRQQYRLRGRARFLEVYNQGRTWSNQFLVLKALSNDLDIDRHAFAVGRRLGKAVVRNRLRRRLREGVRTLSLQGGWDILFVARKPALAAGHQQLRTAAANLLQRAGILATEQPRPAQPTVSSGGGGKA